MNSDISLLHDTPLITHISRRRGRPRTRPQTKDTGTPELRAKKQSGETAEVLDMCLEKRLITTEQHWCGIHLRWLYTLRHGAPTIRAVDPAHIKGLELKNNDPEWYVAREKEYHQAIQLLKGSYHTSLLMSVCIYNEAPHSLYNKQHMSFQRAKQLNQFIEDLKDGLDILVEHWQCT